ncbi:MAG: DMT family transporter [Rhodobacteraceae bacterium]|nr:DMT family transporter [Paracoccaceae bacterium]
MELWVFITFAAAAIQTVRLMLQKRLKGAGLSTGGATFSRFLFAAPLAIGLAAVLTWDTGLPEMSPTFWIWALAGGLMQILGTFCTVALFSERNFGVGIAFTKTETVQVVVFSMIFLGEAVAPLGLAAILLGMAGVVLLSLPPKGLRGGLFNKAMALGLLAGAGFGLSAIGYRAAAVTLGDMHFVARATVTLAAVTSLQTIVMTLWLRVREPGQLTLVAQSWKATAPVGLTGMLGSLGWFTAFTLQNAAYVRALGQVELVFGFIASVLFFRERVTARELAGAILLMVSLPILILSA